MLGSLAALVACSTDDLAPKVDRGTGGMGGSAGEVGAAGSGGGVSTTGGVGNGGDGGNSQVDPVNYKVPAGGGEVTLSLPGGGSIEFAFPASAAGQDIQLTPGASEDLGWEAGTFSQVIHMEPDGLEFDDPVIVTPSNNDVLVFSYPTQGEKGPAEGLPLSADGKGIQVHHFSSLVVLQPGMSCTSSSGWNGTRNHESCAEAGTSTTRMEYGCKAYEFCLAITASCCTQPGATACKLGDPGLTLSYVPVNPGAPYDYCSGVVGGTGGGSGTGGSASTGGAASTGGSTGAGGAVSTGGASGSGSAPGSGGSGATTGSGGGSGVTPTVSLISPDVLAVDSCPQTVTVYGTGFESTGTVFIQGDVAVETTFISSTVVEAVIPWCGSLGGINGVGFVNDGQSGFPDWANKSNQTAIAVMDFGGTGGAGSGGGTGAGGGSSGGAGSGGGSSGGASSGGAAGTGGGGGAGSGGAGGGGTGGGGPLGTRLSSQYELNTLDIDDTYAYYANGEGLYRTPLDGSGPEETLVTGGSGINAIEVAYGQVFMARQSGVAKVAVTGGTITELVTSPPSFFNVTSIGVDSKNVFFTGSGYSPTLTSYVGSVSQDGAATFLSLVTGEAGPNKIAVDTTSATVYYANGLGSGTNPGDIMSIGFSGGTPFPQQYDVSPVGGTVFANGWLYYSKGTGIERTSGSSTVLNTTATNPGDLALTPDGFTIFYIQGSEIREVSATADFGQSSLVTGGLVNAQGIETDGDRIYYITMGAQRGVYALSLL